MKQQVTIISLIYRSPKYAVGLWKSLLAATPQLRTGEAVFFFVANNANSKTLKSLKKHQIPFIEFKPSTLSDEQHFALGFSAPEYIGRVYAGYNFGIKQCVTEKVVLINSDMVLSPNWLSSLLSLDDGNKIVSPTLVERYHPRFGVFPGAIEKNFGSSFRSFKKSKWAEFLNIQNTLTGSVSEGGPYMPALFRMEWFKNFGLYPEGNLRLSSENYENVSEYGDQHLFRLFKQSGIEHITDPNSFCYHFKEGERSDSVVDDLLNLLYTFRVKVSSFIRKLLQRK